MFYKINQNMKEYITIAFLSLITILAPIKAFIFLIAFFVFVDTVYAIIGVLKKYGLSHFKSTKLFNIVIKTFFYSMSILLVFLIDKYIFDSSIMGIKLLLTKSITLLWTYIEIVSINETSMNYFGNKSIWVHLKELVNKGKDIKKDLNDITE